MPQRSRSHVRKRSVDEANHAGQAKTQVTQVDAGTTVLIESIAQ